MRQRSERASTGTGRRSSSDRSRRSSNIDSADISQRYEALRRVLPDPAFVANANGDMEILSAPFANRKNALLQLIDGRHIQDTSLPDRVKLTVIKGIERTLSKGDPVRLEHNLTDHSPPLHFEIQLTRLNQSEVLGVIHRLTVETPKAKQHVVAPSDQVSGKSEVSRKTKYPTKLMNLLEQERRVFRHQISQELARAVMPIVQRMKERARPSQRREAQFLEAQLNAILATDIDPFWERYSALTPREMELCELLKGGLSSRQVSQTMNVTLATVHKHREQIRRKLGFQHKRVNLSAYLRLHTLPVRT